MARFGSLIALLSLVSCFKPTKEVSAGATKPMSPADGAKDYEDNPGGPMQKPIVPGGGGNGEKAPTTVTECPPTCSPQGGWIGCGLTKIRGAKCESCTPKCKGKGSADEGWYDCDGVLIVARACGG